FAARIIGCDDTAEDVVQRAFIRFWEGRERWRSGSSPKLILYKIVRGLALNQLESDRARARRAAAPRMPRPTPVATPAQILDESELAGVLERALDGLSPRRKEALVLTRFHDLTHAEVAD